MRLHQCTVYVYTAQDMVQCVSQATSSVSSCVCFLWLGRCEGSTQKHCCLRTLRGGSSQLPHQPPDRTPERPCRESPGLFVQSLSHSLECSRQWVVNPPARLCGSRGVGRELPLARLHASLNASAASESTTAGSLEAFSQSSAGAERKPVSSR